jgi:hypothetical protein
MIFVLGGFWPNLPFGQAQSRTPREDAEIASAPLSGDYIGMEKMENYDPEEPEVKWFYENKLIIRGNEAILDKVPVYFRDGKKTYSAADGGFVTFRGRFLTKDGKALVSLRIFESDYIVFPIGPSSCEPYSRVKVLPVKTNHGRIEIGGVLYKSKLIDPKTRQALLDMLKNEPMEYTGKHPYRSDLHLLPCR